MRVQAVVRALVLGVALPVVIGSGCSGDSTAVVRVTGVRFGSAPPSSVTAGTSFTVTVELLRSNGDVAEGATQEVTLILLNPGTAVLNGTTTADAVDGVATFSGLSINIAGAGRQLHASTTEFATQSAAFSVAPGAASTSESSVSPAPGNVPPNSGAALTFTFKDAFGNLVASKPVSLTTSLAGSVLTPSSGVTSASGTFVTEFSSSSTGSATLGAVVDGVPVSTAAPYVVVAGLCPVDPVPMAFPGTVNGTQPCGGYIATANVSTFYSFTAPAGGARFTISGAFPPEFEVKLSPSSNDIQIGVGSVGELPVTVEWLVQGGPYLFRLGSNGGGGAFTLTSVATAGNSSGVRRVLLAPGAYSGQTLAAGDETFNDGSFVDLYFFVSQDACRVTLQSSSFPPYLAIDDAVTGVNLIPDVTTPPGVDAVLELAGCHGGTNNPVVIYANSFTSGQGGSYTLEVESPPPPVGVPRANASTARVVLTPLRVRARDAAVEVQRMMSRLKRR